MKGTTNSQTSTQNSNKGGGIVDSLPINTVLTSYAGNIFGENYINGTEKIKLNDCEPDFINTLNLTELSSNSAGSRYTNYITLDNDKSFWYVQNSSSSSSTLRKISSEINSSGKTVISTNSFNLKNASGSPIGPISNIISFKSYIYLVANTPYNYSYIYRFDPTSGSLTSVKMPKNNLYHESIMVGSTPDYLVILTYEKVYYTDQTSDAPTFKEKQITFKDEFSYSNSDGRFGRLYYMDDGYMLFFSKLSSIYKESIIVYRLNTSTFEIDDEFTYEIDLLVYGSYSVPKGGGRSPFALNAFYDKNSDSYVYCVGDYVRRYDKKTKEHIIISPLIFKDNYTTATGGLVDFYYFNNTILYSTRTADTTEKYVIYSLKTHERGYYPDTFKTLLTFNNSYCITFIIDKNNSYLYSIPYITSSNSYLYDLYANTPASGPYEYTKYK